MFVLLQDLYQVQLDRYGSLVTSSGRKNKKKTMTKKSHFFHSKSMLWISLTGQVWYKITYCNFCSTIIFGYYFTSHAHLAFCLNKIAKLLVKLLASLQSCVFRAPPPTRFFGSDQLKHIFVNYVSLQRRVYMSMFMHACMCFWQHLCFDISASPVQDLVQDQGLGSQSIQPRHLSVTHKHTHIERHKSSV